MKIILKYISHGSWSWFELSLKLVLIVVHTYFLRLAHLYSGHVKMFYVNTLANPFSG